MNSYKIFDAHCDTLCQLCDNGGTIAENPYNIDIKRMSEYKEYTQVFACFIAPRFYDDPKSRFDALYKTYMAQNFSGITPILSLEGGEVIDSLEDLEYLKERGVRCIALTWNNSNKIASGVLDIDTGLTEFGKRVVRRMEDLSILVDVSHLSDKAFYDVAKIAAKPFIATHSNSRSICNHPRNLTDEMFELICESGGCVGINLYPKFLTENEFCSSVDALRHIERFIALGGIDSIGFGADFDGTDNNLPIDITGCQGIHRILDMIDQADCKEKLSHKNFMRVFGEE